MFEKLRSTLRGFVEKVSTKELSERELSEILEDLKIQLLESDVAFEIAEQLTEELKNRLAGRRVSRREDVGALVREAFRSVIEEVFRGASIPDLVEEAKRLCRSGEGPLKIVFLGVNGVGKTTTIAKFAYMFRKNGVTPVLAAADTFRAGAQEQLRIHASRLGVPLIAGKYGADPASVAYDAIAHASSKGFCVVLIDTAGRMHTDKDLVDELRKIVRVSRPHYKILVLDALTGNDAVEQARFFDEAVGVDLVVLTKIDADAKGGGALSVAYAIRKPIAYVGVGQDYDDLQRFDVDWFLKRILS